MAKRGGAKSHTLLRLYKQYVRPILETGCVVTSMTCATNVMKLQRIQNSALRVVLRAQRKLPVTNLYTEAKIEMLADRLMKLRLKAITRFGNSESIKVLEVQWSLLAL